MTTSQLPQATCGAIPLLGAFVKGVIIVVITNAIIIFIVVVVIIIATLCHSNAASSSLQHIDPLVRMPSDP